MPYYPTFIGGGTLITGKDALPLVPDPWRCANGPLSSPPHGVAGFMETRTYSLEDSNGDTTGLARAVRVTFDSRGEWAVVALPKLKPGRRAEKLLTQAVNLAFRRYLLPMMEAKAGKGGMAG